MKEIVFNSGTYEVLLDDADRLGFTYVDEEGDRHILVNGPMAGGGGYFLNVVGTIYEPITPPVNPDDPPAPPVPRDGFWGRLRANGDPSDLPTFSDKIIQYVFEAGDIDNPGKWVNAETGEDAPDWVATIGMIA